VLKTLKKREKKKKKKCFASAGIAERRHTQIV
jgi:hypothetical protein